MIEKIKEIVSSVKNEAISNRRHLHRFPELSFQEYKTSEYVQSVLRSHAIDFEVVADTGVLAKIVGKKSNSTQTVILRADMDALPIHEENDTDFTSQNEGIMHACGHDFHTANLLAVLSILKEMEADFSGTVVGIFQPAEEKIPGGALSILAAKKLPPPGPDVKGVIGLHVSPGLEVGRIGVRPGKFMASADEIFISLKGKGGHGAQPHLNIDPVVIAAQLILSLQQIVSRFADPAIPSVLSFGKVLANGATNVIPNEVTLEGTFRTMDESWRKQALELIEKQIKELPPIYGATAEVEIRRGYPVLVNDEALTGTVSSYLKDYVSADNFEQLGIWTAAEDFAYYSYTYPALFYFIGTGNAEKGMTSALHTPTFQIDEDAFEHAIGAMVYSVLQLLDHA
ncbi:M20 family metallopeptidase [Sphingobacterium sp. SGG-5]|uniref:M20 metallopeptidase family protein n=1 Tax=Sphingobacterium sp. SGG-5 TaxID=2710881 RepID=UPI0019D02A0E|nr:M20 family metallopeptidase [Sphingobacterium sp. SGG-5]